MNMWSDLDQLPDEKYEKNGWFINKTEENESINYL